MRSFAHLPIGRKFALLTVGACALVLALSGLGIGGYTLWQTRANSIRDYSVHAEILAATTAAALVFEDKTAADELLRPLHLKPHVLEARLHRLNGTLFSHFARKSGVHLPAEHVIPGRPISFDGGLLIITQPVTVGGRQRGTVVLEVDYAAIRSELLWPQLSILGVLLAVSLGVAGLFAAVLHRFVSDPLHKLAAVARRIAKDNDYSVRAGHTGPDEIGQLAEAFNTMLARIGEAHAEIRATNERLAGEIAERTRLQDSLVATSRLAGMAEVATGVLHNVGNVLNSVNISANLLRDGLDGKHPSLAILLRTAGLLRSQADLTAYLAHDPKGRLVAPLLIELTDELVRHHGRLFQETTDLANHIEHIKQIVTVQQDHARSAGVVQAVDPADLFAEALRITAPSRERHQVKTDHAFNGAGAERLTTDRHQVVQILVNFLANAVQAVKAKPLGERQIVLGLARTDDRWTFTVEDNGVGIPAENLEMIFQHGFTTRRDGHGFGLHSGALAARRLGGRLSAHSDGAGRGARFSLELPHRTPERRA